MQSHTGIIRVFPAISEGWTDASFRNLRAIGAFLVSTDYKNGEVQKVIVYSKKGGKLKIINPFTGKIEEKNTRTEEVIEWHK